MQHAAGKFAHHDLIPVGLLKGGDQQLGLDGPVVDEEGLEKVLAERADFKYASDVAPENLAQLMEKYPAQVFATAKKMGAETAEANMNAGLAAARQIVDFLVNGNRRFQVNK